MNKSEQTNNHAEALKRTMHALSLQNDFINQMPAPNNISKDELLVRYAYLHKALGNMFDLNQHLIDDIDSAAAYLYDLSEEAESDESN